MNTAALFNWLKTRVTKNNYYFSIKAPDATGQILCLAEIFNAEGASFKQILQEDSRWSICKCRHHTHRQPNTIQELGWKIDLRGEFSTLWIPLKSWENKQGKLLSQQPVPMKPVLIRLGLLWPIWLLLKSLKQLISGLLSMILEQGFDRWENLLLSTALSISTICNPIGSRWLVKCLGAWSGFLLSLVIVAGLHWQPISQPSSYQMLRNCASRPRSKVIR